MKYCTLLVTLKCKENDDGTFSEQLTSSTLDYSSATTVSEAKKDAKLLQHIQDSIDKYNATCVSRATKIQYFNILISIFVLLYVHPINPPISHPTSQSHQYQPTN